MRRHFCLVAAIGLCLLASGCGRGGPGASGGAKMAQSAPEAAASASPMRGEMYRSRASEAADFDSGPTERPVAAESPRSGSGRARTEQALQRESRPDWRQSPGSGQLTAGSIDDADRADEFREFVAHALDARMFAGALVDVRPQVMLQVTTADGRPVGGAEISIAPGGSRSAPVQLTSGSDGRAMLTVSDFDVQTAQCQVTVRPPKGGPPIEQELPLDESICRIVVPNFEAERPVELDLALIIDTTGSMGDELEYLKAEIDGIVATLRETFPNVDQRYALVVYRDQGDQYVSRTFDFTRSLDEMRGELSRQRASGGGDMPEAVHIALQQAAGLDWRRGNVARVAFLVGDAPPHDGDILAAFGAVAQLRAGGVRLYPVASSGVDVKAEYVMRSAAFLTLGQYLFLTDHSGIGNAHARPHTSQFLVEHLDRLMVRMITSELCGRRLLPDEVLAIERGEGDLPYGPAVPIEPQQHWQGGDRPIQSASLAVPERAKLWLTLGAVLLGLCAYDSLRGRE